MTFRGLTRSVIAVLLATLNISATAQTGSDHVQAIVRQIDRVVTSFASHHHVPGLSIAVIDRGRVLLTKGYGLADVENQVPATADTVYRIASLSKSVTATAAMKLVEGGKLDLDAPIQKYCPDFPQKPWSITTRELLSHESGIYDIVSVH